MDSLADELEIQRFVSDQQFAAMNVPLEAASEMADALIAADYMGERSTQFETRTSNEAESALQESRPLALRRLDAPTTLAWLRGTSAEHCRNFCSASACRVQAQRLLPFAPEYKGFALAAMVETLCGVMAGARYASQLVGCQGLFETDHDVADLGQQLLRDTLPWDANQTPLIPGDKESLHMQLVDDQDGLTLSASTLYLLQELSERFSIKPLVVR
ncbi:uncharacterized protein LOC133836683 [Drosophila sulfurigaster albostrigata]|uniref:uncharacterized protein LOC133836683 n=1 Tax=Drosophila sulfurigaster albostrigata TaxID=89887 RepID=UPI002D219D20|nr:uncharacterized protein LOC133836683 [Drosophila sulfurigaster albostrigata]